MIAYIIYFTFALTLTILGIYSSIILLRTARLPHIKPLVYYLGLSVLWILIDTVSVTGQKETLLLIIDTFSFIVQLAAMIAFALFLYQYLSLGKGYTTLIYCLIGLASFFLILRLTNPLHHLFYASIQYEMVGPFLQILPTRGLGYSLLTGFIALGLGYFFFFIMTRKVLYQRVFYSQLSVTLYIAIGFMAFNVLTAVNIQWIKLPVMAQIWILPGLYFFFFSLYHNLLNLQPIASQNPLEELQLGVISFSGDGIIVDLNNQMCRIIRKPWKRVAGKNLQDIFPEFTVKLEELGLYPTSTNDSRQVISHFVLDLGDAHYDTAVYFTNQYSKATFHDVTSLVTRAEHSSTLAARDPLTGIFNRRESEQNIKERLQSKEYGDTPYCFVVFDIDFFKQINDKFGHQTGDLILKEITTVFNDSIRPADIFGRFGGDEFILLLHQVTPSQAEAILNRIQDTIRSHPFLSEDGDVVRPTISIGAITATTAAELPYDDVFFMADEALYRAKEQGRDTVVVRRHTPFTKATYL